jgi:hypothetical protein
MTDISLSAANVVSQGSSTITHGVAGAAITAGQLVYKEKSSGKFKLADNDGATAEVKTAYGMALNGAADGQPLAVLLSGEVALGSVLTAAARYYLSDTPGGIAPEGDLSDGMNLCLIGIAKSATVLSFKIHAPGVAVPSA